MSGIHHVTAISGRADRNLDFYTRVLGLRLVKKTVNFDDPGTYHLYYGDEQGQPGTILTFFPWERAAARMRRVWRTEARRFSRAERSAFTRFDPIFRTGYIVRTWSAGAGGSSPLASRFLTLPGLCSTTSLREATSKHAPKRAGGWVGRFPISRSFRISSFEPGLIEFALEIPDGHQSKRLLVRRGRSVWCNRIRVGRRTAS